MIQLDVFLLILRLLFIVLLYLFLLQVVFAITRDLKVTAAKTGSEQKGPPVLGHMVVIDGSNILLPGTSFNLEPETLIGRSPTNTIQLPDEFISSIHSRLRYNNGLWYVTDANSSNGTFVNSQRLNAGQTLIARPGDLIQIGFIRFKLTQ